VVLSPLGEAEKMTAVLNSKSQECVGQTATLEFGRFGSYKKGCCNDKDHFYVGQV